MKILILLLGLLFLAQTHIYSAPPKVTYNINGEPLIYHLYISIETGLGASDYLQLVWPEVIHASSDKTKIQVKLISFSNSLQVSSTYVTADGNNVDSNYYITFGYEMTANTWYEVKIYPTQNPTIPSSKLIQVLAKSDFGSNAIVYDSNYAFAYINIESALAASNTLTVVGSSTSAEKNKAASIYTVQIDITPTITQSKGGNFTLQIYYDSLDANHNSGTTLLDFTFMGLCQSESAGIGLSAAILNFCEISSDLSTITFSMNSVTAGEVIRISTQIQNPLYKSIRGIRGYWVEFVSGIVQQNGKDPDSLQVTSIAISDIGNERIYLLWGIQSTYSDGNLGSVSLYKAQSVSPLIIPYNSFNIGFKFTQTSPIDGQYRVKITLMAQGILQGSLVHNFPAYGDEKVFCHYETTQIHCQNVGAFIDTDFRYFISGKAYFNSATASSLTTFGDISIVPIVKDSAGVELPVTLYQDLAPGTAITVKTSRGYLDTDGSKAYHNTNTFKMGNAQVVSMNDDLTLSSTANAMKEFFTGTNNTVGVVPDLGSSQQLVFMLQTIGSDIASGASNSFTMNLLYNNKVISFEDSDSASSRGLDFVGYENSTGNWSISLSPCHQTGNVVCEKYNVDTPDKNLQVRVNTTSTENFYGMYKFQCGQAYDAGAGCGGDCSDECTMFRGWSDQNLGSSVMSMRRVVFPSNYYSSLYADENLMDFVITFNQGGSVVTTGLINAYTLVGSKMQNIKAAYVNYYDNQNNNYYNKGTRIPMMLRIAGGILPSESRSATVIGVFFDDNIQARTFFTEIDQSYAIGCSTSNCLYYPNENINNARNDNWHTNKRVEFYDIPPIQNEFNLLVPVTPNPNNHNQPLTMTIAFFQQNYTVGNVTGLLRTLSVYRLFGTVVTGSITGSISAINSLSRTGSLDNRGSDFDYYYGGSGLNYLLNVSNINANPPNNTFGYGYSTGGQTFGNMYGAGITITCLYYNIFASSTLAFQLPPANTATTCVLFSYLYNQLVSGNAYRNKQWVHTAFCPIDANMTLYSANGNILFNNPQYPTVFSNGFNFRSILTYGYSDENGHLDAYRHQTQSMPSSFERSCTTFKSPQYMPSTNGKQRSTFSITVPSIRMEAEGYDGYPRFRVYFQLPSATISSSGFSMLSECQISDSRLACTLVSASTYDKYFEIRYSGTDVITITSFSLNLYATVSSTFSTAANYTVKIELPQYNNVQYVPFGDKTNSNTYASRTTYCSCQSTFTVGITGRGQTMVFNNLQFLSSMKNQRSSFTFDFGASSYRETFFSTSTFLFNFGFLTDPISTYNSRSDFRCIIYETINSVTTLSRSWKSLTLSSLASVTLTPKTLISSPSSIKYTMKCFGGAVPNNNNGTSMTLFWRDAGNNVQTATAITPPTYTTSTLTAFSLTIEHKRFRTQGFKALYSFRVVTPAAIDQNSRLYFNFHARIASKLDKQGSVECYTRINSVIDDSEAVFTYCEFTNERQLSIWNNRDLTSGSTFYVDVFNIEQPKSTDISNNQKITLTIDLDDVYTNGANGVAEVNDNYNSLQPMTNAVVNIKIIDTEVDSNFIRATQTLTLKIDMTVSSVFTAARAIYLELPASYSEWIMRADTIDHSTGDCWFEETGTGTNLASACTFISKRILKIMVNSRTAQYYTLTIKDIKSPSFLPTGKDNQYRFKVFCSSSTAQSDISHYSFTDYSNQLTLVTDETLIDLSWKNYGITQSNEVITLNDLGTSALTIYTGYFSSVVQLKQSNYPENFQTFMELTLNNYPVADFSTMKGNFQIELGKQTSYFRIAARENLSPGLYSLQFDKGGDTDSQYTTIPPLTLVVNNKKCSLATTTNSYIIPVGGQTTPITINGIKCIPLNDIVISLTFNSTEVTVNPDLSSLKLDKNVIDGRLYIVLRHTGTVLTAGSIVTVTFTIDGTNKDQYEAIPSVTLTFVNAASYQTLPVATGLSSPTLSTNKATFSVQCSQASTVFWGLGIYPSILNTQALDFQARIISTGLGLTSNFTEKDDFYKRVYGINSVSTMQVLSKTLYNLKSNTNYIFKYFCKNQMGLISDSQSINFTSLNYGAYLMKVSITFRSSINYGQYHDLSCSLAESFKIPYDRIMTETMSYCNNKGYVFYHNDSSVISNQADSSGQFLYNFYILPDYTIPEDTTNVDVRNALSLHSFTSTIITSTNDYLNLPQLVQMQTQDIQVFSEPTLSRGDPISGLNSVVVSAAITNMNGFIIVGVMDGVFNATTMTLPTTSNIKKGLFQETVPLKATKMLFTTQNYNVTFEFSTLDDNTEYSMFIFATSQDPTLTATSSTVGVVNAKTLQALTININYEKTLFLSIAMLVLVFIGI